MLKGFLGVEWNSQVVLGVGHLAVVLSRHDIIMDQVFVACIGFYTPGKIQRQ